MIHNGENVVRGVPVIVRRKRIRRINIRIGADGIVSVSLPLYWTTLKDAEEFLLSKWDWVVKTRAESLQRPRVERTPVSTEERESLTSLLEELMREWCGRLGEPGVTWKTRALKSIWGSCHWQKRVITYNTELVRKPRNQVEYVVVHELSHLQVHDHGPRFQALMDARLPNWRILRQTLNHSPSNPNAQTPADPNTPQKNPEALTPSEAYP